MSNVMNDIIVDTVKVGTMLVVSQALLSSVDPSKSLNDPAWMQASLYTLLGFASYHLLTKNMVKSENPNPIVKAVMDDWLKVGTMLLVSNVLSTRNVPNMEWVRSSLGVLCGFTVYRVLTSQMLPNNNENEAVRSIYDDSLQFLTMLSVSQLLSGGQLDYSWAQSTAFTLVGFAAYNVGTKRLADCLMQ